MSMFSWTKEGFGYKLLNDHNFEKIRDFVAKELDDIDIYSANDVVELEDLCGDRVSRVVADIINDIENVTLFEGYDSCAETDQEDYLGIMPRYPWTLWEKDMITLKDAVGLFQKYADILDIDEQPEAFTAHYFG